MCIRDRVITVLEEADCSTPAINNSELGRLVVEQCIGSRTASPDTGEKSDRCWNILINCDYCDLGSMTQWRSQTDAST